jgi:hypothetical protein
MSRLADRLASVRQRSFVGRAQELALFRSALVAPELPFYVLHISGPGGVGKTTLLSEFARLSREAGVPAVLVDGRDADPSPDGFLQALRQSIASLHRHGELPAQGADDPLTALTARSGRQVLLVDTYEFLSPLDNWLREHFFPQLSDSTLVALAGRHPPLSGWRADPGWQELTRSVHLTNFGEDEARDYLTRRNVPPEKHDAILDFTRGHPLALSLVVEVLAQKPDVTFEGEETHDIVKVLIERFLQRVPTPTHRAAVEASAMVRSLTEPLLAVMLDVPDVHEIFDWLRDRSFIEIGPHGLFPHDLAREALETDLRWRNREQYVLLNRRAHQYYVDRMKAEPNNEQNYLDFAFLHKNPVIRSIFIWDGMSGLRTGSPRPEEWPELVAMVERHEGPESAHIAAMWFQRQPESVIVTQDAQGQITGFIGFVVLREDHLDAIQADPCTRAAWRYLRTEAPLRPGEHASVIRFWMAADTYQAISPTQGVIWVIAARLVLTASGLARSFHVFAAPDFWAAILLHLDIERLPQADFEVGGRRYGVFTHDWRARPVDAWLRLLAEREVSEQLVTEAPRVKVGPVSPAGMSETDFAAAVRDALRDLTKPAILARNPLAHARLVNARVGAGAGPAERGTALRALLLEAIEPLKDNPRDLKLYRALYHAFVRPAPSQEAAAEQADVPFSTFRRHLKEAIQWVTAELWAREFDATLSTNV